MKTILAIDQAGNKLLEFISVSEDEAPQKYKPITVCLLVVKMGDDIHGIASNHVESVCLLSKVQK